MLITTLRSLALVGVVGFACSSQAVELLYDNFDPFASTGTFVGQDDWQGGDRMIVPSAGSGNMWALIFFTGHMGATVAGTYTNVLVTVEFYRTVNLAGSGFAFADMLGSTTVPIGGFSAGAPGVGVDFSADVDTILSAPPTDPGVGYGVRVAFSATGPGKVVPHYRNQNSIIPGSSSSQGWYRDLNDDGTLGADEYEVFAPWAEANLMFELGAIAVPVPEPASAAVLLFPLGVLALRRKKASRR